MKLFLVSAAVCSCQSFALASEFFVALNGDFSVDKLVLPEDAKLIKTLPNLELFMVESSQFDLKIKNAKFVFRRSPFSKGKQSSIDNLKGEKTYVDTENGISGPYPWGVSATKAPKVWKRGYTGKGVKVLVLDTGYLKEHPALVGAVKGARDFTRTTLSLGVPYAEYDVSGHSTHIAGIIAGNGYNGLYGVSPGADLYIGKICVYFSSCNNLDSFVEALEWGISEGVNIVNMSFGTERVSHWAKLGAHVFTKLEERNILAVVASGNEGDEEGGGIYFPANQPTVLTVGSHNYSGSVSDFSSWGTEVDVVAPGEDIVSASLLVGNKATPKLLAMASGTSMAAPHVVGVSALLFEAKPKILVSELRKVIRTAAVKEGNSFDPKFGHGVVDAEAALSLLLKD